MKKVLITGGSGLLGVNSALVKRFEHDIILGLHNRAIDLSNVECRFVNLQSFSAIQEEVYSLKPDLILNATGLTSVELCEENKELAHDVNCRIASDLAIICQKSSIKLVHISTDHLFDGSQKNSLETEAPCPLNEYGLSKLRAEERVLTANTDALIVRTNFYGWGTSYRSSFSDFIIKSLRANRQIELFSDVYYTPIIIEELINTIFEIVSLDAKGIFNVVGSERLSKFEFGQKVAKVFQLDTSLIVESSIEQKVGLVKRPSDMSLSNQKVSDLLKRDLGGVTEHLLTLRDQEQSLFIKEIQTI